MTDTGSGRSLTGRAVAPSASSPAVSPVPASIPSAVVRDACDLLAERTYGNPARSPGHNARVILESALRSETGLWQPIESAPKGPALLVYFDHDADPYYDPADPHRLTDYAANAEGGDFLNGRGIAIAVWTDGYHESDGWESANSYWVPGCWMAWLNGDVTHHAVNAIYWTALPDASAIEARSGETAQQARSGTDESAARQGDAHTAGEPSHD